MNHQEKVFLSIGLALGFFSSMFISLILIPIVRTQNTLTQADNTLREVDKADKDVAFVSDLIKEHNACRLQGSGEDACYKIAESKVNKYRASHGLSPVKNTSTNDPKVETPQSYQPRDAVKYTSTPKATELDRATVTAQDCFAENSGRDQRVCIPYLVDMEEAAKRDAIRK